MEEYKTASILINLHEGSISISGTEEFVEKNMNVAFEFVERNIHSAMANSEYGNTDSTPQKPDSNFDGIKTEQPKDIVEDKYIQAGVYHIDSEDGTISILKKVPGTNKSEKAKNIALIVLYIRKGKIPGKDIIPICEKHACYDSSNFSAVFKNEKTNIVRKGSGQAWTIELTQPGEMAAVELLEGMANDKK